MIRIRQHGENNTLFDITNFLKDIDDFLEIDSWHISVGWCSGENAKLIEHETENGKTYTDSEFRNLYSGIFQTIDGEFELSLKGNVIASLLAVDSTFWQIQSANSSFEQHMLNKYGAYEPST